MSDLLAKSAPCGCTINRITRRPNQINRSCPKHGYLLYLNQPPYCMRCGIPHTGKCKRP